MKKISQLFILIMSSILFFSCDNGGTEIARLQGEISQLNRTVSTLQNKLDSCQQDLEVTKMDNSNHSQKENDLYSQLELIQEKHNAKLEDLNIQLVNKDETFKRIAREIYSYLTPSQKEKIKHLLNEEGFELRTHAKVGNWLFIVSGALIAICVLAFAVILFVKIIFGEETRKNKLSIYRLLAVLMGIFIYFVVRRLGMSIPQFLLYSYDYPALFFLNISVSTVIGYVFSWFLIRSLKKNHETAIRWSIVFSILLIIILVETLYNGFIEEINSDFILPNATFIVGALINLVFNKRSIL